MSSVGLLVGCFVLGAIARRTLTSLPADSHRVLNTWVLYVSMPALVFRVIHAVPLKLELVWAVLGL